MLSSRATLLLVTAVIAATSVTGCGVTGAASPKPRTPTSAGSPRIELKASRIDFGSIDQTSELTTVTTISNRGTGPLKVLNLAGT